MNKIDKKIFMCVLLICVILGGCFYFFGHRGHSKKEGVAYIQAQENKDTKKIQESLAEKRKADKLAKIESGELDVFSLFDDYVILGDSRVLGFIDYNFLPSNKVLASRGAKVTSIEDYAATIKEINPSSIYLSYGVNDLKSNVGNGAQGYSDIYKQQIQMMLDVCPHAKIYVNSIIPVSQEALKESPDYEKIPEYNAAVKQMCEENGWIYIDNDSLMSSYPDLYEGDGIHFKPQIYQYWSINMIDATEE